MVRIVGSLTTLPDREDKLLRTLQSLKKQTVKLDDIYLGVPKIAKRLNLPYPDFSNDIKKLVIIVPSPTDYGPLTKIYGGLISENDPETIIITFDDDVNYPEDTVEKLIKKHQMRPDSAIADCGFYIKHGFPFYGSTFNLKSIWSNFFNIKVPENGRKCDILCGVVGVLYIRKFFPIKEKLEEELFNHALNNNFLYLNDDVLISGYLSKRKIPRYVFSNEKIIVADKFQDQGVDVSTGNELSADKLKFIYRFNNAITAAKDLNMFNQPEDISMDETIAGQILFVILILILLLCLFVIFWDIGKRRRNR